MLNKPLSVCCLLTTVCASLLAQQPEANPAPAAPPTAQSPAAQGSKDALQVAFIDAAGNGRVAISDAANRVLAMDAAGRTKFMETLRAIAAVAPKPGAAEPAKPATSPSDTKQSKDTPAAGTPSADVLEQRHKDLTTLLGGAWLDPADGAEFAETPGYRRLIQMLNDPARPGGAVADPPLFNRELAMQAPDMQRGEVVKLRGLVAGLWAQKLDEKVLEITDVWRLILTDSQAEAGVVVDVISRPPALTERRDTVEVIGHFYRLVSYKATTGKTLKIPYLLARSLRVVPTEFDDEIKLLMASVVTGAPEAKAALAKLAENKETGTAALQRLDERGKAIFERCLLSTLRKKMLTNAVYAGQYNELASFQPEAGQILLRWAQDAPKDAPNAESFPSACVRALRDVVPADQATDAMREALRKIAAKGQSSGKNDLFVGAVCALHQYGDPSIFDKIKEGMTKRAASESEQEKLSATNMLAELHYQLRDYNEAANHFKSLVGLIEASGQTQGLPTVLYNTACVLSLGKNLDESFQYLERALQADKTKSLSRAMLDEDQDLKNLREDPRFGKILESFGKPASAGK